MSRQKRSQGSKDTSKVAQPERATADVGVQEQASLGNSTMQSRMDHSDSARDAALHTTAALARTMVEHGMLVLQLTGVSDLSRQLGVLSGSRLDRRAELMDRLQADAERVREVDAALDVWVGGHDDQARWSVDAALVQVLDGLAGRPGPNGWMVGDREVALSAQALKGSPAERSSGLVADVASAVIGMSGASMGSLCLALQRAVAIREEEEEDWFDLSPELD